MLNSLKNIFERLKYIFKWSVFKKNKVILSNMLHFKIQCINIFNKPEIFLSSCFKLAKTFYSFGY